MLLYVRPEADNFRSSRLVVDLLLARSERVSHEDRLGCVLGEDELRLVTARLLKVAVADRDGPGPSLVHRGPPLRAPLDVPIHELAADERRRARAPRLDGRARRGGPPEARLHEPHWARVAAPDDHLRGRAVGARRPAGVLGGEGREFAVRDEDTGALRGVHPHARVVGQVGADAQEVTLSPENVEASRKIRGLKM
jgi:hypothetical protein